MIPEIMLRATPQKLGQGTGLLDMYQKYGRYTKLEQLH